MKQAPAYMKLLKTEEYANNGKIKIIRINETNKM
jgi:hypothetical protein